MDPKDLRNLRIEKIFLLGKPYRSGKGIGGMIWDGLKGGKKKI
jgi:hypothetical protein